MWKEPYKRETTVLVEFLRVGLLWKEPYKRGTTVLVEFLRVGLLWKEPYKRGTTVLVEFLRVGLLWKEPYKRGTTVLVEFFYHHFLNFLFILSTDVYLFCCITITIQKSMSVNYIFHICFSVVILFYKINLVINNVFRSYVYIN